MKYSVWLSLVLGPANPRVKEILNHFKTAKAVFDATDAERLTSGCFSKKEINKIKTLSLTKSEEIVLECNKEKIRIIPFGSPEYPNCLSQISDPPIVLYVKGKMPNFDDFPAICIVGPRKITDFGKKAAYSLSFRLAAAGFIVVSGGAKGCDTYVHAGALKAGGVTALCMGCGILSDYLKENEKLRKSVSETGCLISEFPPHSSASKFTFPIRNRIMSALSLGTVVIEAGEKSGALITAHHANEQGRDVFVIPAAPDKKESVGSNALLRDGAKPLIDVSDIFNEYILRFPNIIDVEKAYSKQMISAKKEEKTQKLQENIKISLETLSKNAKIVYNQLDRQKFFPEEISVEGLTSQELLAALTELEMEFLIKAVPGGMFEKI